MPNPLVDNLIGYWPLAGDANSGGGTITDVLTAVNTPTYESVAGVGTMAAYASASAQKHTLADSPAWNFEGISWAVYFKYRPTTVGATVQVLCSKFLTTGNQRQFQIGKNGSDQIYMIVYDKTVNTTTRTVTHTLPIVADGTVYDIFCGYQHGDASPLFVEVNGTLVTATLGSVATILHSTANFAVGGFGHAGTTPTNGNIGRVAVWSGYVPNDYERFRLRLGTETDPDDWIYPVTPNQPALLMGP